jgi:preprotein translocase subunit Sss1
MNTLSSKLTALIAAVVMNGLIMGAVGFLFEIQSRVIA